jgi:phage shock protein C
MPPTFRSTLVEAAEMADRLYRSRQDRMLAGVAGGLAEMWDADPALIRIVWALLVIFTGGVALLVYIVMAIVVPEADDAVPARPTTRAGSTDAPLPAGSGWETPPPSSQEARAQARAARRAARTERGGMSGGVLLGGFLVLLGVFFLVREYLPDIDFNWFWPLVLVALGVVLLASALGRGPRSGGPG